MSWLLASVPQLVAFRGGRIQTVTGALLLFVKAKLSSWRAAGRVW